MRCSQGRKQPGEVLCQQRISRNGTYDFDSTRNVICDFAAHENRVEVDDSPTAHSAVQGYAVMDFSRAAHDHIAR